MSFLGGGGQPTSQKPQMVTTLNVQTSSFGICMPLVWGTASLTGNMIWYDDFTATEQDSTSGGGGKGGGGNITSTTYTYTTSFAMGLCESVVTSIGNVWSDATLTTMSDQGLDLMTGGPGQAPWSYLTTHHAGVALNYPDLCYVGGGNFNLGTSTSVPNLRFEVVTASAGAAGTPDALPSQIIQDIAAAAGFPISKFGDLTQYANFVGANGLFLSPALITQQRAADHLNSIFEMTFTAPLCSEGLLKVIPYGDTAITGYGYTFTPNVTPVYALTDDHFLANDGEMPIDINRVALSDCKNVLNIEFQDRANQYATNSITARDEAHISQFGQRPADTKTYDHIKTSAIASAVGYMIMQKDLYVTNTYSFVLGWRFCLLEPMDIVTITHSLMGLNGAPVRITKITERASDNSLLIEAEDFPQGAGHAPIVAPQPPSGYSTNVNVPPGNANTPIIFEPSTSLSGNPEIWMATSGGATYGGCDIWASLDNVTYKRVGTLSGKSRHGVLTATLPNVADPDTTSTLSVDTSISGGTLLGGSSTDRDLFTTLCYVGGEFTSYMTATLTGVSHYDLTSLRRGAYGSSPASHSVGTSFVRCDEALFKYQYDPALVGKTVYFKLQAYNIYGAAYQDLSALTATAYAVLGAGLATVTGLALAQAFVGTSCSIKWNPLSGASSYTVEVWSGGVKRRTVAGVGSTSFSYSFEDGKADGGPYRSLEFRVFAVSANGVSNSAAVLTANNPQMGLPTGLVFSPAGASLAVSANVPTDSDYAGSRIWVSATTGFNPLTTTPSYDGQNWYYTATDMKVGTYYVRMAHYDVFGTDSLSISAEVSMTVSGPNAGIPLVTSLPTTPILPLQQVVQLSSDGKLYRWNGAVYIKTTDGADLVANSVTADKMYVANLAAITANMGSIIACNFTLDASGYIKGGATGYNTGNGFYLGYTGGAYKFSLGDPAGNHMTWDGSTLSISGNLQAVTGNLGTLTVAPGGSVSLGQSGYNTGVGFWLGDMSGTAKFSIGNPAGDRITWDGTDMYVSGGMRSYISILFEAGVGADAGTLICGRQTVTRIGKILRAQLAFNPNQSGSLNASQLWEYQFRRNGVAITTITDRFGCTITALDTSTLTGDYEYSFRIRLVSGTGATLTDISVVYEEWM